MVVDKPGVIADIAGVMRDENVSMESMIQRGAFAGRSRCRWCSTTHETTEAAVGRVGATSRRDELDAGASRMCCRSRR